MTYIVTTDYSIDRIPAPNLPLAPKGYEPSYQEQLNNVLRLYFNRLDAFINKLNAGNGETISFPYGAFHQDGTTTLSTGITNNSTTPIQVASTAQFPSSGYILIESEIIQYTSTTATAFGGTITRGVLGTTNVAHAAGVAISEVQGTGSPTTIATMMFNNTDFSNGVTASGTNVVFGVAGLYNVQFSAQLLNFTTTDDNVTLWYAQNGVDIPASAGIQQVPPKHGSAPGAVIVSWNEFIRAAANDTLSLKWASDSGNTVVATYPAGVTPVHPVSPAVILTAQFVSA